MIAVYIGQATASPIMAAILQTAGGMGLGWKICAIAVAVGMVFLLAALKVSPMKDKK